MTSSGATPGSVSVVIPVLNAASFLPRLLPALLEQKPTAPLEVLLMDSGSVEATMAAVGNDGRIRVIPVQRFSHGGTRNQGAREARGEFVVFLSQDARPLDDRWLRNLIAPFTDNTVAAVFSRQIPQPNATPMERFFLQTHFPETGRTYRRKQGQESLLFQRDIFFSNVSSAVRRKILLDHPFDPELIMSEDQQFARDIIMAGLAVAYAPASIVLHSHDYTWLQILRRYFDSVYSLTKIFPKHDLAFSARLGLGYLSHEAWMILSRHPKSWWRYGGYVTAKATGTLLGHCAEWLPRTLVRRLSMHSSHWDDHDPAEERTKT